MTAYAYANPANGLRTAQVVDPTGQDLVTSYAYEGAAGFYDLASTTLPAGNSTTDSYYNGTDAPTTATDPCPGGASASTRATACTSRRPRPGPRPCVQLGRPAPGQPGGRADGWTCATYDARGRAASVAYPAFGAGPGLYRQLRLRGGGRPARHFCDQGGQRGGHHHPDHHGQPAWARSSPTPTPTAEHTTTTYDQAGRVTSPARSPPGARRPRPPCLPPTTTTAGWRPTTYNGALADTPAYDANSDLVGGTYANGTTLAYGYDTEGRLYSEAFDQAGGATLLSDSEALSQAGDVLTDAEAGPAGPLGTGHLRLRLGRAPLQRRRLRRRPLLCLSPVGGCGALSGAGANSDRTAMT